LDDISYGFDQIKAEGGRLRFLTLTTSYESDQSMVSWYFNRFRALLAKHGYSQIRYSWTLEKTKTGLRHYHILIDKFIPFDVIQGCWYLATEKTAYRVRINAVQLYSPAGYMAKYLTKSFDEEGFHKGERRYGFSKNYPRIKREKSGLWEYVTPTDRMYELIDAGEWYELPADPDVELTRLLRDPGKSRISRHHHYQVIEAALPLYRGEVKKIVPYDSRCDDRQKICVI
jgi:hypothetical protein